MKYDATAHSGVRDSQKAGLGIKRRRWKGERELTHRFTGRDVLCCTGENQRTVSKTMISSTYRLLDPHNHDADSRDHCDTFVRHDVHSQMYHLPQRFRFLDQAFLSLHIGRLLIETTEGQAVLLLIPDDLALLSSHLLDF